MPPSDIPATEGPQGVGGESKDQPLIVFDGDLDGFIDAGIRWRRSGQQG